MQTTLKTLLILALLQYNALAHHSRIEFADNEIHEIEGEVLTVFWESPHAHFALRTDSGAIWNLETVGILSLDRRGIPRDTAQVGERIKVAGFRSSRRENILDITNVLLPNGTEVVFTPQAGPRWSDDITGLTNDRMGQFGLTPI